MVGHVADVGLAKFHAARRTAGGAAGVPRRLPRSENAQDGDVVELVCLRQCDVIQSIERVHSHRIPWISRDECKVTENNSVQE